MNKNAVGLVPGVFAPLEQLEDRMTPEAWAEVKRLKKKVFGAATLDRFRPQRFARLSV